MENLMEGDRLAVPQNIGDRSQRSSISSAGPRNHDVLVYLVDDTVVRLTVDNLPSVTAQELHRIVLEMLRLPEYAQDVFALWLVSPMLELQLKPKHQPYKLCRQWQELLFRFTACSGEEILEDEPSLQFRRDIFFPRRKEAQIQDEDVLRLMYEEAKYNILEGRYPCDLADCEELGALICRVNLGPYDARQHTPCFLKERLESFLPSHLCRRGHGLLSALWKRGATQPPADEQGLLRAYRQMPEEDGAACEDRAALLKLYRTYLQKCHELPYYGCAFFAGEIDKPAQSLLHRGGRKAVTVAISLEGVYIIDSKEKHVLLGLRFQELSWDHTFPSEEEHILWLEFDGENEGTPVNKLLKVYSKQAELMSSLIEYCIELNASSEGLDQDPIAREAPHSSKAQSPPSDRRHPKLQRQNSVICSRIQHLSTIDYVEEGKEIKRVKPRRTTSFFGRQLSNMPTSYSAVRAAENLEQG
ncbi:FERM domain-containing protein 8 isoform X2 [Sceloporus undulatus]|uniref:FERM domain-containing protein 8 isoform X2 n=1 Tax=Sceloporus undulatus TaxID=8520 RepID=UPI001C4C4851|nr:FERM domain-containing protein 8 isoform X2 [Sceloporus undulatus]XP_042296406.1 FERM domain-containing protein 8 isoform X2 [Sceloporus undulatus]XP_042296407.1 FERM domain-containing protein 8 isoform X2 [Sceloporus undulatus]XP_042296408.1 FERM domain-containing protein 8 isoform X2 [Sceloporus undulatus]